MRPAQATGGGLKLGGLAAFCQRAGYEKCLSIGPGEWPYSNPAAGGQQGWGSAPRGQTALLLPVSLLEPGDRGHV